MLLRQGFACQPCEARIRHTRSRVDKLCARQGCAALCLFCLGFPSIGAGAPNLSDGVAKAVMIHKDYTCS